MSEIWVPPHVERYTAHDLLAAAHAVGCRDVKSRTVRTFVEEGLLDHPRRDFSGRGGGSPPGWWPRAQFDLWLTLLRQRKQLIARAGHKAKMNATLCNVDVGAWLYFGDAVGIPTAQVRRAMRTWAKAYASPGSYAEARQAAKQLVRIAAHPSTDQRLELRKSIAQMAYSSDYPNRENLLYQMGLLVDPNNRGYMKGPASAPISAENLADLILGRAEIQKKLLGPNDEVPNGLLECARYLLLRAYNDYLNALPSIADDPSLRKHPELNSLYKPVSFETMLNSACIDLLTALATAEIAKSQPALPEEFRPDSWLEGKFKLSVQSQESPSPLYLPGGFHQVFLGMAVTVTKRSIS